MELGWKFKNMDMIKKVIPGVIDETLNHDMSEYKTNNIIVVAWGVLMIYI